MILYIMIFSARNGINFSYPLTSLPLGPLPKLRSQTGVRSAGNTSEPGRAST